MVNIAFWLNELCERGTAVAVYDYALYNQTLLGNKSFIFYDKNNKNNNIEVVKKFNKEFNVYGLDSFQHVDNILIEHSIPIIYIIKAGSNDGKLSKVAKNIIHCVFHCNDPHGEVYCSVSNCVNGNNGKYKVLPHIVTLPNHNENMLNELNIPDGSIVIGRHGGKDTFNITLAHNVVHRIACDRSDVYFIFVNTNKFCEPLPNIIHIDNIIDLKEKRKFINTCDAMLWARSDGETFGLSIAEFSICNKPVIACKIGDLAHVHYLNDKGLWYSNNTELEFYIKNIKQISNHKDWNAYRDFSPDKVMATFNDILNALL